MYLLVSTMYLPGTFLGKYCVPPLLLLIITCNLVTSCLHNVPSRPTFLGKQPTVCVPPRELITYPLCVTMKQLQHEVENSLLPTSVVIMKQLQVVTFTWQPTHIWFYFNSKSSGSHSLIRISKYRPMYRHQTYLRGQYQHSALISYIWKNNTSGRTTDLPVPILEYPNPCGIAYSGIILHTYTSVAT